MCIFLINSELKCFADAEGRNDIYEHCLYTVLSFRWSWLCWTFHILCLATINAHLLAMEWFEIQVLFKLAGRMPATALWSARLQLPTFCHRFPLEKVIASNSLKARNILSCRWCVYMLCLCTNNENISGILANVKLKFKYQ